jgi:hypothetical protein
VLFQGFDGGCKFSVAAMRRHFTIQTLMQEMYSDFMTERKEKVIELRSMKEGIVIKKTGIELKQMTLKKTRHFLFKCVIPEMVDFINNILMCFVHS